MPTTTTNTTTSLQRPSAEIIQFPNTPPANHLDPIRPGQFVEAFAELSRVWDARRAYLDTAFPLRNALIIKFQTHRDTSKGSALA